MAGRGKGQGHGHGHNKDQGSGEMQRPDPMDEGGMRPEDGLDEGEPADVSLGRGRSGDSPGHRKQAAGARSARDFAPGRSRSASEA